MGGAILSGLIADPERVEPVRVTTHSAASAAKLANERLVSACAIEEDADANRKAAAAADVVLLAVKPWKIHELIREIAPHLRAGATVISVAAGITLDSMIELLPEHATAIRSMPNTPSLIQQGVTGLAAPAGSDPAALALAQAVFETVGSVLVVEEERIDALSAISGSGPAYLFWFTEQFIAAAERSGFTPEEAKLLAQGTVVGAAKLLESTGEEPAELRRKVTSPNGTTEQAVNVFTQCGFAETCDRALAAAVKRAKELAAG